ncbi:hypothetical protein ACFPRL_03960 [Pseudoclavibacter helvolus]
MTEVALLVALGPGLLQPQVVARQIPSPSFAIPRVTRPGVSGELFAGVSRLFQPVRCERSRVARPRGV